MSVTSVYAAVLALAFFALSVRTLRIRRRLRIPVGDGGNASMLRAMRVHALGLCPLVGRWLHAYGVSHMSENYGYRVAGMALTFTALVGAALAIVVVKFWSLAA